MSYQDITEDSGSTGLNTDTLHFLAPEPDLSDPVVGFLRCIVKDKDGNEVIAHFHNWDSPYDTVHVVRNTELRTQYAIEMESISEPDEDGTVTVKLQNYNWIEKNASFLPKYANVKFDGITVTDLSEEGGTIQFSPRKSGTYTEMLPFC